MSFYRVGRSHTVAHTDKLYGKNRRNKKEATWDGTVNDLTVYKASPEEIYRRKQVHKSRNIDTVKQEKINQRISKARSRSHTPNQKRNNLTQEVIYNQEQLQDVLSRSDRAMAVVKDIFGDAPLRQKGIPHITMAPGSNHDPNRSLVDLMPTEPISKLEQLSETVMDKDALNESSYSYVSIEEDVPDELGAERHAFQSKLDMDRFKRLLISDDRTLTPEPENTPETPSNGIPIDTRAINATEKVKKTRSRQVNNELRPTDLEKVIGEMESEMYELECESGLHPTADKLYKDTGYTMSLVTAVTKLVRYVRQMEHQLQEEVFKREKLSQDVILLHQLADGLTSDLISTQEEYGKLLKHFELFKQNVTSQMVDTNIGQKEQKPIEKNKMESRNGYLQNDLPIEDHDGITVSSISSHVREVMDPAVLLSPPRQTNSHRQYQKSQLTEPTLPQSVTVNVPRPRHIVIGPSSLHQQAAHNVNGWLNSPTEATPKHLMEEHLGHNLDGQISKLSKERIEAQQKLQQLQTMQEHLHSLVHTVSPPSENLGRMDRRQDSYGVSPNLREQMIDISEESQHVEVIDKEKNDLEAQISELNQQHLEVQQRMSSLLKRQSISPSVSPIPWQQESQSDSETLSNEVRGKKSIPISVRLPMVEISASSTPSPQTDSHIASRRTSGRSDIGSNTNEGWFALATHT